MLRYLIDIDITLSNCSFSDMIFQMENGIKLIDTK